MKKTSLYILVLIVALSFSACNKSVTSRLPGTWTVTNQTIKTVQTIAGVEQTSNTSGPGGTYTFKSDGTGTTTNTSSVTESFTWKATDNSITFTDADGSYTVTVVTNDKKAQKWSFDYTQNLTVPPIGQILQKVSGTLELAKQ